MIGCELLLALSAIGVDYGWRPNEQGKLEYIIQIEPELLNSLSQGREIVSFIDPQVRGVRCFRVRVGTSPPPREMPVVSEEPPNKTDLNPIPAADPHRPRNDLAPRADQAPATNPIDSAVRPDSRNDDKSRSAETKPDAPERSDNPPSFYTAPPRSENANGPAQPIVAEPAPPIDSEEPPRESQPLSEFEPAGPFAPVPFPAADSLTPAKRLSDDRVERGGQVPLAPKTQQHEPVPDGARMGVNSMATEEPPPQLDEAVTPALHQEPSGGSEHQAENPADDLLNKVPLVNELPDKPWFFTCLLLFASLGGNVYLGWICSGVYRRYRRLATEAARRRTSPVER
jgi:hypothetical protein